MYWIAIRLSSVKDLHDYADKAMPALPIIMPKIDVDLQESLNIGIYLTTLYHL